MQPAGEPARARHRDALGIGAVSLLALAALARALVTAVQPAPLRPARLAGDRIWLWAAVALLCAVSASTVAPSRGRVATGLALLVTGGVGPSWGWEGWAHDASPVLLAVEPLAVAGVAVVLAGWAAPSVRPPPRSFAATGTIRRAVVVLALAAAAVHLLGYDPYADPGCRGECADRTPPLDGVLTTHSAVVATAVLTVGAVATTAALIPQARMPGTLRLAAGVALVLLCAAPVAAVLGWTEHLRPLEDPAIPATAAAGVAAAVLGVGMASRRIRRAVQRLATGLSTPEADLLGTGRVRAIAYKDPEGPGWVVSSGAAAPVPTDPARVLELADEQGPALLLELARHDDEAEVLAGMTVATGVALANARLAAVGRARLLDVRASQRRIVVTGDAERRRIERDLHDSVQQRLVSAALHIEVARTLLPSGQARELSRAGENVRAALGQLRRLAHGVFPAVLSDEGLVPALEDLVSAVDVEATLDVALDRDVPEETALAAYATVAAVLASAHPPESTVACVRICAEGSLTVRVTLASGTLDPSAAVVVDATDRVGAVGGLLTVSADARVVTAVLPCAS